MLPYQHQRIVTMTKVYIASNSIHVEIIRFHTIETLVTFETRQQRAHCYPRRVATVLSRQPFAISPLDVNDIKLSSLAGPISGLMTAACYDWPTRSAKLTETTEAWLASCSAKERLWCHAGYGGWRTRCHFCDL